MGPKKQAQGGKKKPAKKVDDDDALLDAAMATATVAAKEQKKQEAKKESTGIVAFDDRKDLPPKEESVADHPQNPYPKVESDCTRQTWPEPFVKVNQQFKPKSFPHGEAQEHPGDFNTHRVTSEELRAAERLDDPRIQELRECAEVHRQVRTWAHSWIKPGLQLMTITNRIEGKLEELIGKDGIKRGQAFPTGCSLNHVAAHYTPNTGDKTTLGADDVMKIDYGTQINGNIIDCAWTWTQNNRYDPLLAAVKAATDAGIKAAGIDVRLGDIGAEIQEVMESYEIDLDGKTYQVKSIRNLSGHSINPYIIHAGKSVPIVKSDDDTKMEEGELFAVETFGSTGRGAIVEDMECSHYMINPERRTAPLRFDKAKSLLKHIEKNFSTLAFCRKWLDRQGQDKHLLYLNQLCDQGIVDKYPPLVDVKGCYTAQYEHTILMKPTGKEVLSRGDDY